MAHPDDAPAPKMGSFEILINDGQRAYIAKALAFYEATNGEPGEDGQYLTRMFTYLKDDENNSWIDPADGKRKNMTHGFCL